MADIRVIDNETEPLESVILSALDSARTVKIATAFVKESGLARIAAAFKRFLANQGQAQLVYGVDFHITDPGAIKTLVSWGEDHRALRQQVYSDWSLPVTQAFHPKLYIFTEVDGRTTVVVGSSNLTAGGITTNVEANTVFSGSWDDPLVAQAVAVFTRVEENARVVPSETWLEKYARLAARARRTPLSIHPPARLAEAYRELKDHEKVLDRPVPTQKRVIIEAIRALRPGPDGFVYWLDIVERAERIAKQANADFDWNTFPNSVRGRLNEHTEGKGGDDLFERKGGVQGREGRYRLTTEGESYQGR